MGELKTKKLVRRRMPAANSPEPSGPVPPADPTCGHGGCGMECRVRYVGPTSHIRDHHILHAARGMAHVWTAAIVTGFAIVLTAVVAFNAAQARSDSDTREGQRAVSQDVSGTLQSLTDRIGAMETQLKQVEYACGSVSGAQ